MPRRHRSHSAEFKRQVVAEYHAGETLHALSRRHDLSRNLIRIWVEKAEAGALDEDGAAGRRWRSSCLKGGRALRTLAEKRSYIRDRRPRAASPSSGGAN